MEALENIPASFARERLLEYARDSTRRGVLPHATVQREETNPLCGDVVTMSARISETSETKGDIHDVRFLGSGCIISQAAASLLSEYAAGKSVEAIQGMGRTDVEKLLGVSLSPSRVKCAMLPLVALQRALLHTSHTSS